MCAFAPYDIANARAVGYDVVCNRPKVAAYRAPGSPIGAFAVESVLDMLAQKIGMDPLAAAPEERRQGRHPDALGPKLAHDGYAETIKALIEPSRLQEAARQEPGARRRVGLLVQRRRRVERDRARQRRRHRRGGDRQPRHRRLARLDGDHGGRDARRRLRPGPRRSSPTPASVGYTHVTGGSRVTFATGMAVVDATKIVIDDMCARAAKIWGVDPEAWSGRTATPSRRAAMSATSSRCRSRRSPPSAPATGGPIVAAAGVNPAAGRARLRHPVLRRRGRSRDRQGDDPALRRRAGRRPRHPPELCRGADPGRRRAGHRLGAERGIHLRRQGAAGESRLPRLPHPGRAPTCR